MPFSIFRYLRDHRDDLVREWETLVRSEARRVELTGDILRDDLPALLAELATWLETGALPGAQGLRAAALRHAVQRLDRSLDLEQFLREFRLLRETILRALLRAEREEPASAGPPLDRCEERALERARLNAGLDLAVTDAVQDFIEERDRRATAERARADAELARFFELSVDMLAVASLRDGRWKRVNAAMTEVLGWSADELLATPYMELVHPADRARSEEGEERRPYGRPARRFEHRVRRKDGAYRWIAWNTCLYPAEGLMYCVGRDVTARRAREDELRASDRRKTEFLALLSHELRNPLAPIRTSIHLLERVDPASDVAKRAHEVLRRQTDQLARLVDDILDVTRMTQGRIELHRERVELGALIRRTGEDFRATLEARGIRFEVTTPHADVWADADATRVAQMVGNLLHNAAKFTRRGDTVALSLRALDGSLEVVVGDTGAGMDPSLLAELFQPFVQGKRTLARTEGGLGVGLALVRRIAELHGGTAVAASAGPGHGASFTIRLPRADAATMQATPGAAPSTSRGVRRILVVDDNPDAADTLAEFLRMLGHDVAVAHDGPSAIERAQALAPDLVLCDVGLPGMTGYEVARALHLDDIRSLVEPQPGGGTIH